MSLLHNDKLATLLPHAILNRFITQMEKVKLVDVAKLAEVSKSTVSQYLNGRYQYMSAATKARIEIAIGELNYAPNQIARSLKTKTTKTIGVITRDIVGYDSCRTIRGIDDYCKSSEYNVLIYNTDFDPDREARSIKALRQLNVDGIIIASSGKNSDLISKQVESGLPLVQFQIEHDDAEKNIILPNHRQSAFDATEYLIQLGHKRICFVTQEFKDVRSRNERYRGYIEALTKHGIPADDQLILYWARESGLAQHPSEILDQPEAPTAFFCQHLAITTTLLEETNKAGISIPTDVSVLGFDDVPMTDFFKVPITVVKHDPHKVGMEAAKLLLEIIDSNSRGFKRVLLPCSLVERQSCKKL